MAKQANIKAACAAIIIAVTTEEEKRTRPWVHPYIQRRDTLGAYHCLMKELKEENPEVLRNFLRMDLASFYSLLEKVSPLISKQDTVMRQSIPAGERLAVTLRYLASGDSYASLHFLYRIPKSSLTTIIPETCEAMHSVLKDYLKVPTSEDEWKSIARAFYDKWNFPNCVGALDGKHIVITGKRSEGSYYFNYKHQNSLILLALVDAECNFIYVDVGTNGRISDSTVFSKSSLYSALEHNALCLPSPQCLTPDGKMLPFVIVADDAFPLKTNVMKPYSMKGITTEKRIFNYRLSRARRTVENAFGILANRFRVFHTAIPLNPQIIEQIVLATCSLHNFLRRNPDSANAYFSPVDQLDPQVFVPQEWEEHNYAGFQRLQKQGSNFSSNSAREMREEFCSFFNGVGEIPFQHRYI